MVAVSSLGRFKKTTFLLIFCIPILKVVDRYYKKCGEILFFKKIIFDARTGPYRFKYLLILAFSHNFLTNGRRTFCLVSMDS